MMDTMKDMTKNRYIPTFIFLLLCLVFCMVNLCCSATYQGEVIMEEPMKRLYPLIDDKAIRHKYRDNFDKLIFPRHNKKLIQYCSEHRHWEDIRAVWSKNGGDDYRWQYYVNKHLKSFK